MPTRRSAVVNELARLVGWDGPGVGEVDWSEAERKVGFPIPASFKEHAARFPAGEFQTYLAVQQLRSSTDIDDYVENVRRHLRLLRVVTRGAPEFAYGIHPTMPGLVPWGVIETDYVLCWYLTGMPEDSPMIVMVDCDDASTETFDCSMAEFILAMIRGEIPALEWIVEEYNEPRFDVLEIASRDGGRPVVGARDFLPDLDPSGLLTVPRSAADALHELLALGIRAGTPRTMDWAAIERPLPHPLPQDYKRFIETLGPGVYGDIAVDEPAAPAATGLVVWGRAPDGWSCGWVPGGYPVDQRPIVLFHPGRGAHGRGHSMTSYLAWHLRDPKDWMASLWRVGEPE